MFLLRAMWYELHGGEISRYDLACSNCILYAALLFALALV